MTHGAATDGSPPVLVLDSSIVLRAAVAGSLNLPGWDFVAPRLLWSEVLSALHEATWRGEITPDTARQAREAFADMAIRPYEGDDLAALAWTIADELGLAKTYDAEFLALARLLGTKVLTTDARLRRGADRTGLVVGPTELSEP